MSRRRAYISVTPELLEQIFVEKGLPKDIRFIGVKPPEPGNVCTDLYFESSEFDPVPEGAMAPINTKYTYVV